MLSEQQRHQTEARVQNIRPERDMARLCLLLTCHSARVDVKLQLLGMPPLVITAYEGGHNDR
jgi:hypothetical protein